MDDKVSIQINESFLPIIEPTKIMEAVNQTLDDVAGSKDVSLTVVFENDEILHQLNYRYLGIDAPTDVLAFPSDYVDTETGIRYLGDIIISIPQAQEQASSGKHSLDDELQLLVVHGILHLLGYDHLEENEKDQMQATQSAILIKLGSELKVNL